jgi:hypothetical protein
MNTAAAVLIAAFIWLAIVAWYLRDEHKRTERAKRAEYFEELHHQRMTDGYERLRRSRRNNR